VWLGAHIGISNGLPEAPVTGRSIGCDAIQIFAKSPKLWDGPPIVDDAAAGFRAAVAAQGLKTTAIHHGYLANLATPKKPMLGRSRKAFLDELGRAEKLGVDHLIFHPGAHMGSGRDAGITTLVESLNGAFAKTPDLHVRVLLENSAGQGSSVASTFLDLAEVLSRLEDPKRAGVAIDTCHLFASGVDFRSPELYGGVMDRLDRELGRDKVFAFHLNDAKADLGSHLDRHEHIGAGQIGLEGFRSLVNDPGWAHVAGFLETPMEDEDYGGYRRDLSTLRGLIEPPAGPSARVGRPSARPTPK
jgi:deoxyribonuclease-4